jgi:hypothetical protein
VRHGREVERIVSSHKYPADKRTVMVVGLLATIIQYHQGVLHLVKSGSDSSSYSLVRDMGERYALRFVDKFLCDGRANPSS